MSVPRHGTADRPPGAQLPRIRAFFHRYSVAEANSLPLVFEGPFRCAALVSSRDAVVTRIFF